MLGLFLGLLGFAVLVYGGYPLAAFLMSLRARGNVRLPASIPDRDLPTATLVIPAHNEESVIEAKLRNSLPADLPAAIEVLKRVRHHWEPGDESDPLRGFAAWPIIDLLELMAMLLQWSPKRLRTAVISALSPRGVAVS